MEAAGRCHDTYRHAWCAHDTADRLIRPAADTLDCAPLPNCLAWETKQVAVKFFAAYGLTIHRLCVILSGLVILPCALGGMRVANPCRERECPVCPPKAGRATSVSRQCPLRAAGLCCEFGRSGGYRSSPCFFVHHTSRMSRNLPLEANLRPHERRNSRTGFKTRRRSRK